MLERLNTEADTGSFKKIVNGRSIKFKDATHYNNKQNINEEIKDYNEENEGVKKMSLLYAKSHRNNGRFVNNLRQLCIYIYIYIYISCTITMLLLCVSEEIDLDDDFY